MSIRGKQAIIRLARSIVASNSAARGRCRLKGSLHERGKVVQRLQDLIYQLRTAGDGRDWSRSDTDTTVHELRTQANDTRLPAAIRCRAVITLAVLEGLLPTSELDDTALSTHVKSLVAPKAMPVAQSASQSVESTGLNDIEAALARFAAEGEK